MGKDMCVPCEGGLINLRVGAIIMKDGQILMAGNKRSPEYLLTRQCRTIRAFSEQSSLLRAGKSNIF